MENKKVFGARPTICCADSCKFSYGGKYQTESVILTAVYNWRKKNNIKVRDTIFLKEIESKNPVLQVSEKFSLFM